MLQIRVSVKVCYAAIGGLNAFCIECTWLVFSNTSGMVPVMAM